MTRLLHCLVLLSLLAVGACQHAPTASATVREKVSAATDAPSYALWQERIAPVLDEVSRR